MPNYYYVTLKHLTMDETQDRSELIANKLIECDNNGELNYNDQLKIINHYIKRFNFTTKSQLAKERGVSPSAITQSIGRGKEMVINLNGTELICN